MEGKGLATIHDVIITMATNPQSNSSKSLALINLLRKRTRTEKALERCLEAQSSLKAYLRTLNTQYINAQELSKIIEEYEKVSEQLDDKVLDIQEQLELVIEEIKQETKLQEPNSGDKLRTCVGIDLFATSGGQIEIILIYGKNSSPPLSYVYLTLMSISR